MKLKFHPRPGHCVYPVGPKYEKQVNEYAGRRRNKTTRVREADDEPYVCESDTPEADHIKRHTLKGAFWAADQATATYCGVEFVPVAKGADGEFHPVAEKQSPPSVEKSTPTRRRSGSDED